LNHVTNLDGIFHSWVTDGEMNWVRVESERCSVAVVYQESRARVSFLPFSRKGGREKGTHSERGKSLSSIVGQHPVNLRAKDPSSESVRRKTTRHQSLNVM